MTETQRETGLPKDFWQKRVEGEWSDVFTRFAEGRLTRADLRERAGEELANCIVVLSVVRNESARFYASEGLIKALEVLSAPAGSERFLGVIDESDLYDFADGFAGKLGGLSFFSPDERERWEVISLASKSIREIKDKDERFKRQKRVEAGENLALGLLQTLDKNSRERGVALLTETFALMSIPAGWEGSICTYGSGLKDVAKGFKGELITREVIEELQK